MKAWIYTVVIRVTNALGYFQKPQIDVKYKMVSIDLNQMIGVHVYLAMGAQVSWSAPPSEIFRDLNKSR